MITVATIAVRSAFVTLDAMKGIALQFAALWRVVALRLADAAEPLG